MTPDADQYGNALDQATSLPVTGTEDLTYLIIAAIAIIAIGLILWRAA